MGKIKVRDRCGKKENREMAGRKTGRAGKPAIVLFWIVLWSCLALLVDNRILLSSPLETAGALFSLMGKADFYSSVAGSFLRIAAGFLTGLGTGACLAAGSRQYPLLEEFLSPAMHLLKAVPVASFVVLLLIWWGSSFLAAAVCFLVVLPVVYLNMLEGFKSTDGRLLEMAQVFRIPFRDRLLYIYRPALQPFLRGALKISLGMCWKSGVAAEVIGTPDCSIGEQLYLSKIYLDTAGIFAWTAVVILLSILFEKLILRLADCFFAWEPPCRERRFVPGKEQAQGGGISFSDLVKCYDGRTVLNGVSAVCEPGQTCRLAGPSGSGKTTLLRILARLTLPDSGQVTVPPRCSMVFQEDRLCEDYSALKNVELVTGDRRKAKEALSRLLDREALDGPCSRLSGGMKRRVSLVRAMEVDSDYVLLDEPFTGMDGETMCRAQAYIRERQGGRMVVIASHILPEAPDLSSGQPEAAEVFITL